MEALLGVCEGRLFTSMFADFADREPNSQKRFAFTLFTASNSYALAAPNAKELQSWATKLDPTRLLS